MARRFEQVDYPLSGVGIAGVRELKSPGCRRGGTIHDRVDLSHRVRVDLGELLVRLGWSLRVVDLGALRIYEWGGVVVSARCCACPRHRGHCCVAARCCVCP